MGASESSASGRSDFLQRGAEGPGAKDCLGTCRFHGKVMNRIDKVMDRRFPGLYWGFRNGREPWKIFLPAGRGGKILPAFCAVYAAGPHWYLGGIKGTGDSVFSKAAEGEVSGFVKAVIGPEHGEEAEKK